MCKIQIQKKALTIYRHSLDFRHCNAIDVFDLLYCLIHLCIFHGGFHIYTCCFRLTKGQYLCYIKLDISSALFQKG